MATTPASISKSARGITRTLAGYVVQNESITENAIAEEVADQTGAIADAQIYDHRWDLSLTLISTSSTRTPPAHQDDRITYDSHTWIVDSVEEAGTYNTVVKYNVRAHRYDNFPSAT